MDYLELRDRTAEEIADMDIDYFSYIIFGFDFNILIEQDVNDNTVLRIDNNSDEFYLLSNSKHQSFNYISELIKSIESDLDTYYHKNKDILTADYDLTQIRAYVENYENACINHFTEAEYYELIFHPDENKLKFYLKALAYNEPFEIDKFHPCYFEDDREFIIEISEYFYENHFLGDYINYFANFDIDTCKDIVRKCMNLKNEFESKAVFINCNNSFEVLFVAAGNEDHGFVTVWSLFKPYSSYFIVYFTQ